MHRESERHIDWAEVRRRLGACEESLDRDWRTDERTSRLILQERAARLSATASVSQSADLHAVFFHRGSVAYATELARLQEIQICHGITWLPGVPPFCLGVINMRGEILPVFDVPQLFDDGGADELPPPQRILVVESGGRRIGLAADLVDDAVPLHSGEIGAPLSTFAERRSRLVHGLARGALLLDCRALVEGEHLVIE